MKNVVVDISKRQVSILTEICKGNPDGTPLDLDQLLERVNYTVSKQAIQFSLRRMIKKGLIKKIGTEVRREKRRVIYSPGSIGSATYSKLVSQPQNP